MNLRKITILGGSIAGLYLANLLEQVGIDFLIPEAEEVNISQLSASI